MSNEAKIVIAVSVVMVVVVGVLAYFSLRSSGSSSTVSSTLATADPNLKDAGQIMRSDAHTKGDTNAKVTVVEFADYECPACKASAPIIDQLMQNYQGKGVQFVFRNFPLPQHKNAELAANAAEAAGAQGKYWEMHDELYNNQDQWVAESPANATAAQAETYFVGYAKTLGLDTAKFQKAVDERAYNSILSRDLADAQALQLPGTPSFFVNGKSVESVTDLQAAIDAALK